MSYEHNIYTYMYVHMNQKLYFKYIWLSDPVEKKMKEDERREKKEEKTPVSSYKALFRFSSLLQNRHSM